jgi:hypothetical protein
LSRPRRIPLVALAATFFALALPASGQAAVHGLRTGFTDFTTFQTLDQPSRLIGFQHAKAAGASIIRVTFDWSAIAPSAPPNIATSADPNWSGYVWGPVDQAVRETTAEGFTPLFLVTFAPAWAEGPGRPPVSDRIPEGTWRPSPTAFQAFATALAKRYSGSFPDPENPGQSLPKVIYWQGWNEPNLSIYLAPQWVRSHGKLVAESPKLYRALQNAWYRGLKSVSSSNTVVTAGTSPFGDTPGHDRMYPAQFWREVFCLKGRRALKRFRCSSSPVRFDILAHHPYPIGPPRRHAPVPDDVVIADWSRITKPLKRAIRLGTVAPRRNKQLWATEFSWDSNPPDPQGVPARLEATYMEGAFSTMWSQGVTAVIWYLMRDQPPNPSYAATLQSGVYLRAPEIADDKPKPSFTAFRFPFTAYLHKGRAQLWGLAPSAGPLTVQAESANGSWKTVAHLSARSSDRMFLGSKRLRAGTTVRAVQGSDVSLTWRVFSPGK